jgi:hypothetical protein
MNRPARTLAVATAVMFAGAAATPSAWALDPRTEAAAKGAIKKAAQKYRANDYASALILLGRAAHACGASRCAEGTKAAVLRDLGAVQLRSGDKLAASKSFSDALALQPSLDVSPDYDAADVRAAWDEAKGGAAPSGANAAGGDFVHTPAPEQATNTPLPVYVESPGSRFARVIVKYKGAHMKEWQRLELKQVGDGWGGVIPCDKVTLGAVRYWVEGLDANGEAVATAGDPEHPFTVPIRDEISGEAPHLPNRPAPQECEEDEGQRKDEEESAAHPPAASEAEAPVHGEYSRWWIGVAGAVDLLSLPEGDDLCALTSTGAPQNASGYYCTNPNGSDFPSRTNPAQNASLIRGQAGHVDGGLQAGDVRVLLAVDYALTPEILVGARVGYLYNSYPGSAAVADHRAFGSKAHVEVRGTYVFGGEPLQRTGFAPTAFVGGGASEFDGHTTAIVAQQTAAPVPASQPVNVWLTNGPWFLSVGPGVRYQFSARAAFTAALRLNVAFGGLGALITYGPETGFQYGF